MAQNIYDDPDFFAGYSSLPRQVHGLDGAPEWGTLRAMLPDLAGLKVADLGCGFGWAARLMRQNGAASVAGFDLSRNMIERAKADTADAAITYERADLETLTLSTGSFDLIFSALAFHYVADFDRLATMLHAALAPDGKLVFSIEHPIFMAAPKPRWIEDADGQTVWPVAGYAEEGERRTDWFANGVLKYHRRLATTINALITAGFAIRQIDEFAPSAEQISENPQLAAERDRPMFLLVAASRL